MRVSKLILCLLSASVLLGLAACAKRPPGEFVTSWNEYHLVLEDGRPLTLEGTIFQFSPTRRIFCSGPFQGAPGTLFVLDADGTHIGVYAFAAAEIDQQFDTLPVGTRVRLQGSEGKLVIFKDAEVMKEFEGEKAADGRTPEVRCMHLKVLETL